MPAKDRYHETVLNALKKEGWSIEQDPATLFLPGRRLYIDILARRGDSEAALIEVKVFEDSNSPITYLANTVGQYLLYQAALDYLGDTTPLYLAVPILIYHTLLSEEFVKHFIQHTKLKLVLFDPTSEEIVEWIT